VCTGFDSFVRCGEWLGCALCASRWDSFFRRPVISPSITSKAIPHPRIDDVDPERDTVELNFAPCRRFRTATVPRYLPRLSGCERGAGWNPVYSSSRSISKCTRSCLSGNMRTVLVHESQDRRGYAYCGCAGRADCQGQQPITIRD